MALSAPKIFWTRPAVPNKSSLVDVDKIIRSISSGFKPAAAIAFCPALAARFATESFSPSAI